MNNGRLAFFNLVKEMRAAQKEYFRTRAHSALVRSKDLQTDKISPRKLNKHGKNKYFTYYSKTDYEYKHYHQTEDT